MRKVIKLLGAVVLACVASAALIACAEGGGTVWLSPMMSVSLEADKVDVYEGFDLAALNAAGTAPAGLLENAAVTKATVGIAYKGDAEYKAQITVRIDEMEVEEDGAIGHHVAGYNAVKSETVSVLFYGSDETWYDGAYGSNAVSGGDTLFDGRYYQQTDAQYSETRLALPLNKTTADNLAALEFYIVGLADGYYVVNFCVETADAYGHFHGTDIVAMTAVHITVGTPVFDPDHAGHGEEGEEGEHGHEH